MARKSPWQEFTNNFNSVYGTFTKLGKNMEAKRLMDEDMEFYAPDDTEKVNPLIGLDKDRARMRALADIYTKYGDAEGGLKIRSDLAAAESAEQDAKLQRAQWNDLVKTIALQNANMESKTSLNYANAGLSAARASEITKLLGPKYDQAVALARNAGYTADIAGVNAYLAQNTKSETLKDKITELNKNIRTNEAIIAAADDPNASLEASIAASQRSIIEKADQDAITTKNLDATQTADINATNAGTAKTLEETRGLGFTNDALAKAAEIAKIEDGFMTTISSDKFWADQGIENPTVEQREKALIDMYTNSNIPIERQNAVKKAIRAHGLDRMQNVALEKAQEAKNIMQTKGLPGLIKWYDGVDDGDATSLDLRETEDGFALVKIAGTGENAQETILYKGADKTQIEAQLMGQITSPGKGMELAASILDMEKTKSETKKNLATIEFEGRKIKVTEDTAAFTNKLTEANISLTKVREEVAKGQLSNETKRVAIAEAELAWRKESTLIDQEIKRISADATALNANTNAGAQAVQNLLTMSKKKLNDAQIAQVDATVANIKAKTKGLSNTGLTLDEVSDAFLELITSDMYINEDNAEAQQAMRTSFWANFPELKITRSVEELTKSKVKSVKKLN